MGRTKVLEFDIGDIVEMKKHGNRKLLIVNKVEKHNRTFDDPHLYAYTVLDLLDGEYYGIYSDCNNKHYKKIG